MQTGFSLAEILFALALTGIIFVCLIQILLMGHFAIRQGNEVVTVTNIAQDVLDRTHLMGFNVVPALSDNSPTTFDGERGDPAAGNFPPSPYPKIEVDHIVYNVRVTSWYPNPASRDMKRVDVTVFWRVKSNPVYGGGNNQMIERSITVTGQLGRYY